MISPPDDGMIGESTKRKTNDKEVCSGRRLKLQNWSCFQQSSNNLSGCPGSTGNPEVWFRATGRWIRPARSPCCGTTRNASDPDWHPSTPEEKETLNEMTTIQRSLEYISQLQEDPEFVVFSPRRRTRVKWSESIFFNNEQKKWNILFIWKSYERNDKNEKENEQRRTGRPRPSGISTGDRPALQDTKGVGPVN